MVIIMLVVDVINDHQLRVIHLHNPGRKDFQRVHMKIL